MNNTEQNSAIRYPASANEKEPKRKKGPWSVIFWIALIVLIGSLIGLGVVLFSYQQGQTLYKGVEEAAAIDIEGKTLSDMSVDWDALLAQNPDTVGWLYIPGTVVNYPLVHTTNDERYLYEDFLGGKGVVTTFGTTFLSAANAPDFSDPNNLIYGHHMNDGSMFASIDEMRNDEKFNAHRTIYVLTPTANYRLESFSLVICSSKDPLAQTTFATKDDFVAYIQDKIDRNVVVPNPNNAVAADMDKIFSLVTCDYTVYDGRAVLFASVVETAQVGDSFDSEENNLVNPDDIAIIDDAAKEIK